MGDSSSNSCEGSICIIATPIGNMADITERAIEALRSADVLYCEDTRNTIKLLNRYGIQNKMRSYHKYNEKKMAHEAVSQARSGKAVALVSDAGTPLVSDPGYALVELSIAEGIPFSFLPGPSAAVAAYVYSGMRSDSFYFGGFLPKREAELRKELKKAEIFPCPCIWFVSVHSIRATLEILESAYPKRQMSLSREMTKIFEETLRGTPGQVASSLANEKGEIAIVLSPLERKEEELPALDELKKELESMHASSPNEALKEMALKYSVPKSMLYRMLRT
ncbi:MAG: 16S rRNA (cytidine(1402)-2'-O)-methyltransferase [Eubacteriaceae bacterium]|jgi:16S rRNA (cytidine1402-2'-O)-methyltransferase|nr:16S rRNA (cytidine(1402)-2'-O)-methyltransferase [Eubacteriaceae bacterium]